MSDDHKEPLAAAFPEPLAVPEKGISLVWLVPLIAALIAAWIGWKTWDETGPMIHITFASAEGIEPGKTRIRYRNVDLGRVERLALGAGRTEVIVEARISKEAERFLNASARFWVVRPRIDPGGISGLTTLVSGAYIELDPGSKGADGARLFMGLNEPPVIPTGAPGGYFTLLAQQLGSIGVKSPVYYRRIQVGEVVSFGLLQDGSGVEVQIFVNAPYNTMIYENTRFWHASGIEASLDADGFRLHTEAVRTLLAGGIGFGIPAWEEPGGPPPANLRFELHNGRAEAEERRYSLRERYLLYFDSSIRGLKKDAPVEFLGITVGRVYSYTLEVASQPLSWRIPVIIEIEPRRFNQHAESARELLDNLVERGLRARLKTGNLLTGQLYVELEMVRNPEPFERTMESPYPVIPTLPGNVEEITQRLDDLMSRIEALPLEAIGANLDRLLASGAATVSAPEVEETLQLANRSMARLYSLLGTGEQQLNDLTAAASRALSQLDSLLRRAETTLASLENDIIGEESELHYQLSTTMAEIEQAARAVRAVAETIERNPNSLILGK